MESVEHAIHTQPITVRTANATLDITEIEINAIHVMVLADNVQDQEQKTVFHVPTLP